MMSDMICGDEWISLHKNERNICYVKMADAALVVPLTDQQEVLLITEPSPAYGGTILCLPGGMVENDEQASMAANRELQEEIGLRAGRMDSLGELYPMIKYVQCRQRIYLGRGLKKSKLNGDEGADWPITVEPFPLAQFDSLIASGRLRDSSVIAALFMARSYLAKEHSVGAVSRRR